VIGGIELAEKIKKGQFKIGKLGGRTGKDAGDLASRSCCVIRVTSIERRNRSNLAWLQICTRTRKHGGFPVVDERRV
jgi:hypothetical protein